MCPLTADDELPSPQAHQDNPHSHLLPSPHYLSRRHRYDNKCCFSFFSFMHPPPPRSTLFPYTTLFRSMAQVVARYVNDHGGLNGHPMQVVTGDAGGDPARALSIVRDMVENKGAIALMGNLWVFSGTGDRKSTRLNSSHTVISYAVFCLK